jgi:hypothetical protein
MSTRKAVLKSAQHPICALCFGPERDCRCAPEVKKVFAQVLKVFYTLRALVKISEGLK